MLLTSLDKGLNTEVIKIAHMSSGEKAKLLMKKAKKGKYKRIDEKRAMLQAMTDAERAEYDNKLRIGEIENRLTVYEWDYNHRQLPPVKIKHFKELLKEYLECEKAPKQKWRDYVRNN